jgi:hypothetical protein
MLKFVHIPKTAGTSIENLANENGIKWGRFDRRYLSRFQRTVAVNVWHCPLSMFKLGNPYQNYKVFTVVRNPFDRVVSNFGCPFISKQRKWGNTPVELNEWIPILLSELRKDPYLYDGHFIPQVNYVFNARKRRMVQEIIKFENLERDFAKLMKANGLSLRLDRHDNRQKKSVTSADISHQNRRLLFQYYKMDFAHFYPNVKI